MTFHCRTKTARRRRPCLWWPSVKFLTTGMTRVSVRWFAGNCVQWVAW